MLNALLAVAALVVLLEVAFHIAYVWRFKKRYRLIPKVPLTRLYVEPHPYLPFVYKKHFTSQRPMRADYPLLEGREYWYGAYTTNNYRINNGPSGDRDIMVPKPKSMLRINCLGGSTNGNYIRYRGRDYSYPLQLEAILQNALPDREVEVNNFGQGGWTSAELLINFLLNGCETEPDTLVIYHAYNDLAPSLIAGFEPDYSHARRNLGETYHRYRWSSYLPYLPVGVYNFFVSRYLYQNMRYSLLRSVQRGSVDYDLAFQGLDVYRRNLDHVIRIAVANGTKVILSTFCFYLYPQVADDAVHQKLQAGVEAENDIMRELGKTYGLPVVENASLIPRNSEHFLDSIHFTPQGMEALAANIAVPILEQVRG